MSHAKFHKIPELTIAHCLFSGGVINKRVAPLSNDPLEELRVLKKKKLPWDLLESIKAISRSPLLVVEEKECVRLGGRYNILLTPNCSASPPK